MSVNSWKLEKGLCRCCHAEGAFKSLSEPSYTLGQVEVFSDMLRQCLDIEVQPVEGVYSETTYTICDACAHRLRDASNFKQQVLQCEERFRDMYKNVKALGDIQVKQETEICAIEYQMKIEQSDDDDDAGMDFGQDGDGDGDEDDNKTVLQLLLEGKKEKGKGKAKPKPKPKPKAKKAVPKPAQAAKPKPAKSKKVEKKEDDTPKKGRRYTVTEHNGVKTYNCKTCNATYKSVSVVKQHITKQHTIKTCPFCDKTFENSTTKHRHLLAQHREKLDKKPTKTNCDECDKDLKTAKALRRHYDWYHNIKKCPECSISVISRKLHLHRHEEHGLSIPTCGVCDYKHPYQTVVIKHQRKVHLKEKNIKCPQCNLKFFNNSYLRRHLVKHEPVKTIECSFCHKKFARRTTMQMHEKIHTGEKNKVCTICGEKFVQKASLNYHMCKYHPEAC